MPLETQETRVQKFELTHRQVRVELVLNYSPGDDERGATSLRVIRSAVELGPGIESDAGRLNSEDIWIALY